MSELFWKLNKATSENGATGEKHAPVIKVEGTPSAGDEIKVTVDVGEGKHPNKADHFIQWVELRVNGLYVGRADFAAGITNPVATFAVVVPNGKATLTALGRCNMHGLWESEPVTIGA